MTSTDSKDFSANNPRWSALTALLFWLFSVAAALALQLAAVAYQASVSGVDISNQDVFANFVRNDPDAILASLLSLGPAHLITLVVGWLIVTRNRRDPFLKSLGWEWGGFKAWHGAAIILVFYALALLVSNIFPGDEHELTRILNSSRGAFWTVIVLATVSAPIVEEVVYRGVLYSAVSKSIGRWGSVVLVAFLFALVHFPQYKESYAALIMVCILSLALTLVRVRTDNLLPCVVIHFVFNGIQFLKLIASSLLE